MTFFSTCVDDWLDNKKKLDGAEGLWRIHDKLYDFTIWARSHPGGQFWINTTRGTDITAAFENHHFSTEAESLLNNYYKKEAESPRNSYITFDENGFFKKFKCKALQQYPATNTKSSLNLLMMSDGLAASVFLSGLLGVNYGISWKIVSGVLLGFLAISCHGLLHSKDNWRLYYFNLSLMSSREWRIRHVLSHHQFRGTELDLEVSVWEPFSKRILNLLLFPISAHLQFTKRCLDVILSKKLTFHPEELVPFSLPLFLLLFSGVQPWEIFLAWNHIILIGSFVYCFFSSMYDKDHTQIIDDQDFGIVQLSLIGRHPKENESVFSFLNSFRGNILHYLCPSVECGSLSKLISSFTEVSREFNISLSKIPKPFPEVIQQAVPEGHIFFS